MKNTRHCHGFYGASSMERLPVEAAIRDQTRAFQDDRPQGRHRRKPGRDNPPFKRRPVGSADGRNDMTGQLIGTLILWLIVAVIVIAIIVYLVNWLYRRSSKEVSFVRTGLFGEKVVINGGAFVLPIIHDVTPVSMNVLRMAVTRANDDALITRDRMRVDIDAEFYVRVRPQREAVAIAAATLGRRTLQPDQLNTLLSGRLVSALRSIASEMTMEEMHEKRGTYVQRVRESAAEAFDQNGLELAKRRHHQSRPDRPAVLQPLQPLRCGRSHADHRGDRGKAETEERHRTGRDDQDPHPQPRSRAPVARYRAGERVGEARPAAGNRNPPRHAARGGGTRASRARHGGRTGADPVPRGNREVADIQRARHQRGAHRLGSRHSPEGNRADASGGRSRNRRARTGREGADRQ